MPRLLADRHIYHLREMLPPDVELELYEPAEGLPQHTGEFDALFVRTVTVIDSKSLPNPGRLRWVGTASAGYDHLDLDYLKGLGIRTASSAGCNARAVAEYVVTMLLRVAWERGWNPQNHNVGIVGVGHVGSQVDIMLRNLGVNTVLYDPPREEREPQFRSSTLDEVLDTDILTLHLPRVASGPWRTVGWLDAQKLGGRTRLLVIQASRGGIADETALMAALKNKTVADAVVDVWEGEPSFHLELIDLCAVATPHIAGYSEEAKIAATQLALDDWLQMMGLSKPDRPFSKKATEPNRQIQLSSADLPSLLSQKPFPLPGELLDAFLWYDRELRLAAQLETELERRRRFRDLRTITPYRTEFAELDPHQYPVDKWPLLGLLTR